MRSEENITIGRVLAPGPETTLVMTKSSSDRVKASRRPSSYTSTASIAAAISSSQPKLNYACLPWKPMDKTVALTGQGSFPDRAIDLVPENFIRQSTCHHTLRSQEQSVIISRPLRKLIRSVDRKTTCPSNAVNVML